jgi:hypothetical protein
MARYSAYGLKIQSELFFPELPTDASDTESNTEPDVVIRFGALEHLTDQVDEWGFCFRVTSDGIYLFWQEIGAFLVRDGQEVVISPIPDVDERVIRLPLIGVISAILLHQRGFLVLHASAIAIQGGVAAFVGEKGQGKSTTGVMLYERGHLFVSDDVVAIDMRDPDAPCVIPGFPQFKLWSDTVASVLGDDPETLPQLHPKLDKRSHRIGQRFSVQPLPLKRIYILAEGERPAVKLLQPQAAMVQLITHSYVSRFDDQLLQGEARFCHFHQCTNLINQVSICCLERPRSLALLPDIGALVEADLRDAVHHAR